MPDRVSNPVSLAFQLDGYLLCYVALLIKEILKFEYSLLFVFKTDFYLSVHVLFATGCLYRPFPRRNVVGMNNVAHC